MSAPPVKLSFKSGFVSGSRAPDQQAAFDAIHHDIERDDECE